MYKKVLLASDGSETSMKAARIVNDILQQGIIEEVAIIYVAAGHDDNNYYVGSDVSEKLIVASQENGKRILQKTKELFTAPEKIATILKTGDAAQNIVKAAKNYDVIVIGSRGMNPVSGILIGSVSNRVVQYADRPVFIIK